MKNFHIALTLFFLCFFQFNSFSQKDTTGSQVSWDWYHLVKTDGTEYVCQLMSDDGREVLIYTRELGKIYIPKSQVKSIKKIDNPEDVIGGEYRDAGPFSTRYYFTNNAFPIKRGENYAMVHLWGPEVHFSLSEKLSLGVMTTWIGSPIALAGKYSFNARNPKLHFSIGTIAGSSGYLNQGKGFGAVHFGNVTYGNRLNNVTFSLGYGYFYSGFKETIYEHGFSATYQNNQPSPYPSFEEKKYRFGGTVFGVSGIAKVGTKASFIFDVLGVVSQPTNNYVRTTVLVPDYYDPNTNSYVWGTSKIEVVDEKVTRTTLIFMPGMRFQKSEKKAFQIAIAGVVRITEDDTNTFPMPMLSWLFKF